MALLKRQLTIPMPTFLVSQKLTNRAMLRLETTRTIWSDTCYSTRLNITYKNLHIVDQGTHHKQTLLYKPTKHTVTLTARNEGNPISIHFNLYKQIPTRACHTNIK